VRFQAHARLLVALRRRLKTRQCASHTITVCSTVGAIGIVSGAPTVQ
jgi:hypothetical protein